MKKMSDFLASTLVAGVLVVTPLYLAALLLLRAGKSFSHVVRPLAKLLPEWLPAEHMLSLFLVLAVCFLIGLAVRTSGGLALWSRIENSVFHRIPGYDLFRGFTHRLAGDAENTAWQPALAEIEEALVPAFIIEEFEDGRFTVFVPAVPTPFAGSIYVLTPDRVHPLNVPFTRVLKTISHWGCGSRDLVAAMEQKNERTGAKALDDLRPVQSPVGPEAS